MRFKLLSALLALVILAGFSTAKAESPADAREFFESISGKDLIVEDLKDLTPEELSDMIRTTHDFCRHGKALRLQKAREAQQQEMLTKSFLSQWQWDALYYEISFDINFSTEILDGYVKTMGASLVEGLSTVEIDLYDNMTVDSVTTGATSLSYTHSNDIITITLDQTYDSAQTFEFYVYYNGHPTEGGFQAFAFGTHGGVDVATTLSEPYFARTWWPCKDNPSDKADSVDIIITHPDNFVCASNGLINSIVDNGDGTKTTHWDHNYPITTYLVAIGVTNYYQWREWYISEAGDSMPVDFFVYPEDQTLSETYYPVTVDMIDTLAGLFGEYPFVGEKYGMLHFDWGGAMEHQTNTSMSSNAYYESIIVHELAHQWWGDMITCENWHEIWMNEGFATYTEALWVEATEGWAFYRDYMNNMRYTQGGTIWCQDTTQVWSIFTSRVYDKGAWVLHMLRNFVGDSAFFEIIHTYYDDPRYKWGDITTVEFRDLCIDVSGDDRLHEFFQDWIWGEYYPKYRFSYVYEEVNPGDYMFYLHLRQTQTTSPQVFDMPVEITINSGGPSIVETVFNDQREQDFVFYLEDQPYHPYQVYVDKDSWILRDALVENYGLRVLDIPVDSAVQYQNYVDTVLIKGGTPPYDVQIVAGSLPDGLEIDNEGQLTGNALESGMFTFTVSATDDSDPQLSDDMNFEIFVETGTLLIGDANNDGNIDVSDAVYIINYAFVGGPDPVPVLEVGDANCDASVDVSDAVYIINFAFAGGLAPGDC
ncbi:MAG: hypothetical protein GF404_03765 [candidate division Zixibacteria bacterium]|nr:hypothetical protein [candidate division Zixibacteria bacterium]